MLPLTKGRDGQKPDPGHKTKKQAQVAISDQAAKRLAHLMMNAVDDQSEEEKDENEDEAREMSSEEEMDGHHDEGGHRPTATRKVRYSQISNARDNLQQQASNQPKQRSSTDSGAGVFPVRTKDGVRPGLKPFGLERNDHLEVEDTDEDGEDQTEPSNRKSWDLEREILRRCKKLHIGPADECELDPEAELDEVEGRKAKARSNLTRAEQRILQATPGSGYLIKWLFLPLLLFSVVMLASDKVAAGNSRGRPLEYEKDTRSRMPEAMHSMDSFLTHDAPASNSLPNLVSGIPSTPPTWGTVSANLRPLTAAQQVGLPVHKLTAIPPPPPWSSAGLSARFFDRPQPTPPGVVLPRLRVGGQFDASIQDEFSVRIGEFNDPPVPVLSFPSSRGTRASRQ